MVGNRTPGQMVVISGYGCICAAGQTANSAYNAVGRGVINTSVFNGSYFAFDFRAPCFVVDDDWLEPAKLRYGLGPDNRTMLLLVSAVQEALECAGFSAADVRGSRIGISLGTTVGCMLNNEKYYRLWRDGMQPDSTLVATYLTATLAAQLQGLLGVSGPRAVITNACASGTDAIGLGKTWLDAGVCDLVICGGADELSRIACHGFHSLMLVSPETCRPFDKNRCGLNLGEGSGIFILEHADHLAARGGRQYGIMRGYGAAGDAHQPTSPHPDGRGLQQAVSAALTEVGLQSSDIAMINGHGTGTLANDLVEATTIAALGFDGAVTPIVSTKGATGHTLGAAGGVEAVFTLMALNSGSVHGTVGCSEVDDAIGYRVLRQGQSEALQGRIGISQSLAFGGGNSVLIIEGEVS